MSKSLTNDVEQSQKFLEALENDFRILANESKKKYPQIKEVCSILLFSYLIHILLTSHLIE